MNTLIITHLLNEEHQIATFGCEDIGVDLFYLTADRIDEFSELFIYLMPVCYDKPEKLPEDKYEQFVIEQSEAGIEDFKLVASNITESDDVVVVMPIQTGQFSDFVDVFNNTFSKTLSGWEIVILDLEDDTVILPSEMCIIPTNLYENPDDVDPIHLCRLGNFISYCIYSERPWPEVQKILHSDEIEKKLKKAERKKRKKNAVVDQDLISKSNPGHNNN